MSLHVFGNNSPPCFFCVCVFYVCFGVFVWLVCDCVFPSVVLFVCVFKGVLFFCMCCSFSRALCFSVSFECVMCLVFVCVFIFVSHVLFVCVECVMCLVWLFVFV